METKATVLTSRSIIKVDLISDSFKKGLKEAQIRQTITTEYPSAIIENEFKDSLFTQDELGITNTLYTQERVTWIPVREDMTIEYIQESLSKLEGACIYRILSSKPIIAQNQKRVIENGLSGEAFEDFKSKNNLDKKEWDEECSMIVYNGIKERQIVRYGEDNTEGKGANEPVLYNGKIQYRELSFSKTLKEDIDLRGEEKQIIPNMLLAEEEVVKETSSVLD